MFRYHTYKYTRFRKVHIDKLRFSTKKVSILFSDHNSPLCICQQCCEKEINFEHGFFPRKLGIKFLYANVANLTELILTCKILLIFHERKYCGMLPLE